MKQTRWFWSLLPFLLLILQSPAIHSDEIESEEENQLANIASKSVLYTPAKAMWNLFSFVSYGNDLYRDYEYVFNKLFDLAKYGGNLLNPMVVLQCVPYVMLALQQAKRSPQTIANFKKSWDDMGMNQFNLTTVMKSPALFREFLKNKGRVNVMESSLKLIAGEEAYGAITKFTEEAQKETVDKGNGIAGIDGQKLAELALKSENFKKLFPTDDVAAYALNTVNVQMSEYLGVKKLESVDSLKNNIGTILQGEGDEAKTPENIAKETLAASSQIFLEIAKKKINQTVDKTKTEAENTANNWTNPDQNEGTGWAATFRRTRSKVVARVPSRVLSTVAMGNTIASRYGIIPKLATYVLPAGMAFQVFRIVCLITYVSMVAQRENINIPKFPEIVKDKVETIPGLDTDKIINAMNNRSLMTRVFGEDTNSLSTTVLKFVAGPEAVFVERIVSTLKDFTSNTGKKLGDLNINDLIGNVDIFQRLLSLTEFKKVMMRSLVNSSPVLQKTQSMIGKEIDVNQLEGFFAKNRGQLGAMTNYVAQNARTAGEMVSRRIGIQSALDEADQFKREKLAEGNFQGKVISQVPTSAVAAVTTIGNGARSAINLWRSYTNKEDTPK